MRRWRGSQPSIQLVNAVPTLCPERAREHARRIMAGSAPAGRVGGPSRADQGPRRGRRRPLHLTARRSSRDHVPRTSDWEVERIEAAGGVVLGKTNTPEFGAGANTFNEVFGITRNPWNLGLTCGGSVRWRGRGAGHRHGLAGRRLGPRRFPAHAGLLLRRRWAAPLARPGTARAASLPFGTLCRRTGRWPATCATSPCSWTCWRTSIRATR